MSVKKPWIKLGMGFSVGYSQPLARVQNEIELEGGTHFLIARNGRGKTTVLRTLAGILPALKGIYRQQGELQYLPEDISFDPEMTSRQLFRALMPKLHYLGACELAATIELEMDQAYGRLSTGNRRKVHLLIVEFSMRKEVPNILLLDEPFSGLDAFVRKSFEELWLSSNTQTLRLVSCHPDYDEMRMPSVLLIDQGKMHYSYGENQTWSHLKQQLH